MPERRTEFQRIERFFAPLAEGFPGSLGLVDDAAVVNPRAGFDLVVTTDTMVAGVHYPEDETPSAIACRLLRVNLSDLAAMGATPLTYTMNLALPPDTTDEWLAGFSEALHADQQRFGLALAGGDTVSTPGPAILTVTAFGEVAAGQALRRSGARRGDGIYVSGTVGDSALGLRVLQGEIDGVAASDCAFLVGRYRQPEPRVALGPSLVGLASAAIDVSDGLAADLEHILLASNVGGTLDAAALPLSDAARRLLGRDPSLLVPILSGGDDYEILFTAPSEAASAIDRLSRDTGVAIARVGGITEQAGLLVCGQDGAPIELERKGWLHG